MQPFINLLAENQLLLLFTVIGIGYLLGNIRILGFSLGITAVLFVGMFFGALDQRLALPDYIYVLGLVLFVYAIGLHAGPNFFASFNKHGLRSNIFALVVIILSAGVAVLISYITHMSAPIISGIYCGALTNAPALAASIETVKSLTSTMPAAARDTLVNNFVVTFGLAYPFGVLGLILAFYTFIKIFNVDLAKEESERLVEAGSNEILSATFRIINPAVIGKTVEDLLRTIEKTGFVLSRIKKGSTIQVVVPHIVLSQNDEIVVVGTETSLERAKILFGEKLQHHLDPENDGIEYRRIFVSNHTVAGKRIYQLHLEKEFGATITRLRRGDVDFVPSPDTILELGDRVRVVTRKENLGRVTSYFGDSIKGISETDFLSLSFGIVLGVFVGMFPIPLPNGTTFKLGFAGGPLVVAILLGRLQRTGSIVWTLPFGANMVLRQIGLIFFLAGIGTKAGFGFGSTFQAGGVGYIVSGGIITSFVAIVTIVIGYKFLKMPMTALMGILSAISTQPAALAYANQQTQNEQPNLYYTSVYPAATVAKIVLAQILVTALWR
ncbi:MAG: TrkA C-terminal domain-containing protein [Bacteroidota bacterium]|nr:TrkA C-terminal domain-containing protein [Bacteroidota bacterium]